MKLSDYTEQELEALKLALLFAATNQVAFSAMVVNTAEKSTVTYVDVVKLIATLPNPSKWNKDV